MQFVKTEDLRTGMRLARPIYNKNGVLLYERSSKLTTQGIDSIKNFGLIGIFVLEPAEPVPPMTQDDIDFERFQTMCVFSIQEELGKILQTGKPSKMSIIVSNIIRNYGHLDKKINFIQNLRSKEDYEYKHALNTAILCAMLTHKLNIKPADQEEIITAAIMYGIGKLKVPKQIRDKKEWDALDLMEIKAAHIAGFKIIEDVYSSSPNMKRICMQTQKITEMLESGTDLSNMKIVEGAKIFLVAETFDTLTAMQFGQEPVSEVAAIRFLLQNNKVYEPRIVDALIASINILSPGVSVELNTGDKALVIAANDSDILRPMLLNFRDNSILDLSNRSMYGDLEIEDVMKTMDNRHIMDTTLLKQQGFNVEEPEYVKVPGGE